MLKFGAQEVDGEHLPESQDEAMSKRWSPEPGTCREKALTKVVEIVERAFKCDGSAEDMATSHYHLWKSSTDQGKWEMRRLESNY